MGLAHTAAAQAPGQTAPVAQPELPTAAFLEKRVPEELAIEGIVLSRNNLGLRVEQLADKWLVSLVDLTTRRVTASTKVDALPPDREAAVAVMTHVAADLTAQIVGRPEPPPPPPQPRAPVEATPIDPAELARRAAERDFRQQSLRFGTGRKWVVYTGEIDRELSPVAFYTMVGRPDLGDSYTTRKTAMTVGFVMSGVGLGLGYVLLFYEAEQYVTACSTTLAFADYERCRDNRSFNYAPPLLVLGGGAVAAGIGIYFAFHRHPISRTEAKALADGYNDRLRRQVGLPGPLLRDVALVPYVEGHQAGLVLGARF